MGSSSRGLSTFTWRDCAPSSPPPACRRRASKRSAAWATASESPTEEKPNEDCLDRGARAVRARAAGVGPDVDQWRGRDLSISDLFEVVRRVRQGGPGGPLQLPV